MVKGPPVVGLLGTGVDPATQPLPLFEPVGTFVVLLHCPLPFRAPQE
jgi:hypothetical protein